MQLIEGFSKLSIQEKIKVLKERVPLDSRQIGLINSSASTDNEINDAVKSLSENYITHYSLPFSIAPNFIINGKSFFVPMVTEESSVVAAASYAAKFWSGQGGFRAEVKGTKKSGQVYFTWDGRSDGLVNKMPQLKEKLIASVSGLTANMEKRGGGISGITLIPEKNNSTVIHILNVEFETADSMGANLINSCLEIIASELITFIRSNFKNNSSEPEILMAILSNYTPECIVECTVECDIDQLSAVSGSLTPDNFAGKFIKAVHTAQENVFRAVTHNKGIFNGIDAVLLATGNDFRAVEACGHAYASRNGRYTSLTNAEINGKRFSFKLGMPMSVGTVGGATSVHPIARLALDILKNPSAQELMQIVSAAGLASNFAAIRSLITDGIQKGHMKLHLNNILIQFNATETEKRTTEEYFSKKQISFSAVAEFLKGIRNKK